MLEAPTEERRFENVISVGNGSAAAIAIINVQIEPGPWRGTAPSAHPIKLLRRPPFPPTQRPPIRDSPSLSLKNSQSLYHQQCHPGALQGAGKGQAALSEPLCTEVFHRNKKENAREGSCHQEPHLHAASISLHRPYQPSKKMHFKL